MPVKLREVTREDLPLLLAWAWIPEIWKYLPTSRRREKLLWGEHIAWWHTRQYRDDQMIMVDGRSVGVVHISDLNTSTPEVGIYIGEISSWGMGIGKQALQEFVRQVSWGGFQKLHAVIHPRNKRSVNLFTQCGFRKIGKARKGQDLYEFDYRTSVRSTSPVSEPQGGDRPGCQPVPA